MKVSVCMATCNGERFLKEQIDSILDQLRDDDEIVISDDHSTDGLPRILSTYDDKRIKLLPSRRFGTPTGNFEYALNHCANDLIFLADQDDVWYPGKIDAMSNALQNADLVVCDCRLTDHELRTIFPSFFALNGSGPGLLRNLVKSSYMGCCMAFRREVLAKALPFPDSIPLHDQWIGLVAERYFRTAFVPEILLDHRRHRNNYSSTGERSRNSLRKKVGMRFQIAKKLLFR
ncbi:MAG TPA: glycosyltransferase family 2 protein [Cyclobacteriaceae bacterium]|nr:glycosyltransferase family 2 protein [Cyclobacteriaceae bacterium]